MYSLSKQEVLDIFVRQDDSPLPATCNPFATAEWMHHWLSQIARDDWRFYLANDPRGAPQMLLYCSPSEPHVLRSPSNYYTILANATLREPAGSLERIGRELDRATGVASLELRPLDPDDPWTIELEKALRASRWYTRRTPAFGNWYLPCAGLTFERYLAERPSQLRNTLKRKTKKFPGAIELCTGEAGLERAITAYRHVYQTSWKRPEPYPEFVPGWMRICAQQGWLRLGTAWLGDVAIAAQFWFVFAGRAHIYKLAYDEAQREHSAGTILSARLMQHVLEVDRVTEVDYGSGDDDYKRHWVTHRRERVMLTACNQRRVRGLVRATLERLAEATAPLRRRGGDAAGAHRPPPG